MAINLCCFLSQVSVEIKYDDKLPEEAGAFVQAALLYTSVGMTWGWLLLLCLSLYLLLLLRQILLPFHMP